MEQAPKKDSVKDKDQQEVTCFFSHSSLSVML